MEPTFGPPLKVVVLGTGDFALPVFEALCDASESTGVLALVTQPDRPQGRKQELIPSRIKQSALECGIDVLQPEDANSAESLEVIRRLEPDLLVTAAYGQILSGELLATSRLGGINLHGSILPAYRGAAPVARAIQNGETETGVTVIQMSPRIDAGGMIAFARTPIGPEETAGELEERLAALGAPLVLSSIDALVSGTAQVIPQDRRKVTKAPKLRKDDGIIDWSMPAQAVHNLVRAMNPWPLASTTWVPADASFKGPLRLIIHKTVVIADVPISQATRAPGTILEAQDHRLVIAAGSGAVGLLLVQIPGKKPMPAADLLRGHRIRPADYMSGDGFRS
jgi:methionyl-tRNA formyltransferase